MGFLDRVKASFSQAMGGTAALTLEVTPQTVHPGDCVDYRVLLVTTGPLKAAAITVGLYGRERVRVWTSGPPGAAGPGAEESSAGTPSPAALLSGPARETVTFQQVETLAPGELVLPAGQTREFQGQIQVPAEIQPTYRGIDALHSWRIRATIVIPLGVDLVEDADIVIR
ncbi:MAG TPA: hypothetical protein VKY74_05410 [Chloroflexia bacterium]|nr:hypothetical protein [Chloroflexia bacterium]